ncbi:TonB family protein [Acuticoccus sp. I52.16.1]|uniref:TonB family protein n=1 Tax=Acuticoccus sp. I52.16.1 TaxID=2928472 RepID=UPI001FD4AD62|nr:TonB family protein [Acuticoccus sp. I52.16.1]UOM36163.1 TonB family protein [Acuticoccus sp. I52.16.1]
MNRSRRAPSLSILDAGGLRPGPSRRMRSGLAWGAALLVAVLVHLAVLVDLKEETEPVETPQPQRMPIVVSQQSAEALLGATRSEPEPAGEDGAPESEAPQAPDPQEGDPATGTPLPNQQPAPAPPLEAEQQDAPPAPEEFDVPDRDAVFDSLLDGTESNPASVDRDEAPAPAEPTDTPSDTPDEAPAEPPNAAEAAATPSRVDDAPAADAAAPAGPEGTDPGGSPTETPGTPAPAQPSLALPDISSAFEVVSGANSDLAAALPDVASQEEREADPEAVAGTASTGGPTERPADAFYPFPLDRPAAGERAPTFSAADAAALERVPVPPANPAPPDRRAAATPKATAAPRAPQQAAAAANESEGAQASYARAVRAIVGRAFFTAAQLGQVGAGTAVVTVTISRDGRVLNAELSQPSGNPALDQAVLAAAYNEFPNFPADVGEGSLSFSVPIRVR